MTHPFSPQRTVGTKASEAASKFSVLVHFVQVLPALVPVNYLDFFGFFVVSYFVCFLNTFSFNEYCLTFVVFVSAPRFPPVIPAVTHLLSSVNL